MSKDELRPAVDVWWQAETAYEAAWTHTGSQGEEAAAAIIEADRAAVREQAERETVEKIVAWLRQSITGGDNLEPVCDTHAQIADAIEVGEWKQ